MFPPRIPANNASDDIYNRWWLHVRGALSPIAGSLPKGMWLTRRSISIIQESLPRFEKFVNHESLSERTCWVFSTRTHVDFLIKSRNFSVPIQTPVTLWQSWHWHFLPAVGHRTGLIFYQRLLPAAPWIIWSKKVIFGMKSRILFAASMNLEECPLSKEELLKLVEEEAAMRVSASFLEQVGHQCTAVSGQCLYFS